jgi:hypothetical protein
MKTVSMVALTLSLLAALMSLRVESSLGAQTSSLDSPIVTPEAPTPTPPPAPDAVQRALGYLSAREAVPIERLLVGDQHREEYKLLGRAFWAVSVLDTENQTWHQLMVDLENGAIVEDIAAVERAEQSAYREKYGKLEPALF